MRYLLDTDWVINYLRGNHQVVERFNQLLPQGIGISIISIAELYEGIADTEYQQEKEQEIKNFLGYVDIIPLDEPVCRVFARERKRLRAQGKLIADFDLLIGSTAICHQLTLLTNNRRHFQRLQELDIISV